MKKAISPVTTISVLSVLAIVLAFAIYQVFIATAGAKKHPREAGPVPAPSAPPPPAPF